MVGASVLVTANTLREVVQHIHDDIHTTPFDREHNAPEPEMELLSFGGSSAEQTVRLAPDGFTPLYRITTFGATIVQRFDPERRTASGWKGMWVNEDPIDSEAPWEDMAPGTFEPVCHGFVQSRSDIAEGRGDTVAPIETMADRVEAAQDDDEPVFVEGQDFVVDVYVPFAISVHAATGDEDMAVAMAIEDFKRSGLRARMDALVNEDFNNSFVISDSDYKTEVGEA
jgi:hypothetical protein